MQRQQDKQNFSKNSHPKVLLHPALWASFPKGNYTPESGIYPPLA